MPFFQREWNFKIYSFQHIIQISYYFTFNSFYTAIFDINEKKKNSNALRIFVSSKKPKKLRTKEK